MVVDAASHSPGLGVDPDHVPVHVGIIMDGNGRWARARNRPRTAGHQAGLEAAKQTVHAARRLGVRYLSLYTFSTENWRRAADEVSFLMGLIGSNLRREYDFYRENGVKVVHSGDLDRLPPAVRTEIELVAADTAQFGDIVVNLAINYGGKNEIVRGIRRLLNATCDSCTGRMPDGLPELITEESFSEYLDHPEIPEADLIIRTAGEQRLSNFLLWRCAYAELVFRDVLWPDWQARDLVDAIVEYQNRRRHYGGAP